MGCVSWAVVLDISIVGGGVNSAQQLFAVVISNAQPDVAATVTSVLQTSAGRMVFGRFERAVSGGEEPPPRRSKAG